MINNAQIRVENSVISGNKRGIHVVNGHAVVRDSVLENLGTEALEIQNSGSSIDAQRCVIRDVRRALYMHNGTGTLINTLIHNVSQQGVYTRNNSTLVMVQCTLDQVTKERRSLQREHHTLQQHLHQHGVPLHSA